MLRYFDNCWLENAVENGRKSYIGIELKSSILSFHFAINACKAKLTTAEMSIGISVARKRARLTAAKAIDKTPFTPRNCPLERQFSLSCALLIAWSNGYKTTLL